MELFSFYQTARGLSRQDERIIIIIKKNQTRNPNQPTIQNKSKITFLHRGLNAILGAKEKC